MMTRQELEVAVKARTEKALLLVHGTGVNAIEAWIPISQIDDESDVGSLSKVGDVGYLRIPLWLARDKGWA